MKKNKPALSKRVTKGKSKAVFAAIVLTSSLSLYPCNAGESREVAQKATKLVESVTAKQQVSLKDLISQIKSLGVTGVVIHSGDILFTHDIYTEKATYTDFGAVIMMRTDQEKTMSSLRKLLGKAVLLSAGGEYFNLA
jgi:hypothetical protein